MAGRTYTLIIYFRAECLVSRAHVERHFRTFKAVPLDVPQWNTTYAEASTLSHCLPDGRTRNAGIPFGTMSANFANDRRYGYLRYSRCDLPPAQNRNITIVDLFLLVCVGPQDDYCALIT